jgi:hypothetical protein
MPQCSTDAPWQCVMGRKAALEAACRQLAGSLQTLRHDPEMAVHRASQHMKPGDEGDLSSTLVDNTTAAAGGQSEHQQRASDQCWHAASWLMQTSGITETCSMRMVRAGGEDSSWSCGDSQPAVSTNLPPTVTN